MNKYSNTKDATSLDHESSTRSQNSELIAKDLFHAGIPKVSLFMVKFSGKPASANWKF